MLKGVGTESSFASLEEAFHENGYENSVFLPFCLSFLSRCPIPEGTIPQSEVAGGVTTNTIGAESISEEEVAPGQVAVTGQGGGGGRTATTFGPEAAMMTIRPIGGCTIGGTVAATGAMTTAGTEGRLTTTQTFGSPMNTIERTAVTEASAAAEGNTEGGGDGAGHSAAHLHTAAGEPRV